MTIETAMEAVFWGNYGRVFVKAHREDHPVRGPVYKLAINWGAPSWTLMMSEKKKEMLSEFIRL